MKFTIKDVDKTAIYVEYEDGTSSQIPTVGSANKEYYARQIKASKPTPIKEVVVEDIPYKKGDTGTVGDDIPADPVVPERKETWDVIRNECYPNIEYRIAAMYPFAEEGDKTRKAALDAHLKLVWDAIPEGTEMTRTELKTLVEELKKDPKFIQVKR